MRLYYLRHIRAYPCLKREYIPRWSMSALAMPVTITMDTYNRVLPGSSGIGDRTVLQAASTTSKRLMLLIKEPALW